MEKKNRADATVAGYLAKLPPDRRDALSKVRATILANLPTGYEEAALFGMISYVVPLSTYRETYNRQPLMLAGLASQKNHMSLHLVCAYLDSSTGKWFATEYGKTGKRLDMGKGCVRFKKLEDLPLDLVGRTIARVPMKEYITLYEKARRKK